mgnify:FL=1
MANAMTPVKDAELAGVRYRDDMGGLEQTYSTGNALPLGKIVVLVDGGTASAAELLAGSLQDTGSATLIGSKTYGKGQGQFHIDLVTATSWSSPRWSSSCPSRAAGKASA